MSLTDDNARAMLLSLAMMHGIRDKVAELLDDCPELPDRTLAALCHENRAVQGNEQRDMAKRGNVSRSTITLLEQNKLDKMGVATLQAIGYAYRIPFRLAVHGQLCREGISCAPGAETSAPGCE